MRIVDPAIDDYLDEWSHDEDAVIREMEDYAEANRFPIIGPQMGRLMGFLARLIGARSVFEMGSGYGYSAAWFAKALPPDGTVILTDGDETNRDRAADYLGRIGLIDKTSYIVGNALEIIEEHDGPFDIVFNDVDKHDYPATIDKAARVLRPGGLFVTDNVLWHGKIVAPEDGDETTAGVIDFNVRMLRSTVFDPVLLPVRDGVMVARKKD